MDIVRIALETFGAPIYVRKEIVHNSFVVNELAEKGAIFVEDIDDVPEGMRVIYSAHGVSPAVRQRSKERGLDEAHRLVDRHRRELAKTDGTRLRKIRASRHLLRLHLHRIAAT